MTESPLLEQTRSNDEVTQHEGYPKGWARIVLMVSQDGEMHAIGGDRAPGNGDTAYIGLERLKEKLDLKGKQ